MSRSSKTDSELSDGLTTGGHHQLMFIILAMLKNVDEARLFMPSTPLEKECTNSLSTINRAILDGL
ncbi:hypothetical protein ACXYMX_08145 [Sporosarcina sp. CAU 1771]